MSWSGRGCPEYCQYFLALINAEYTAYVCADLSSGVPDTDYFDVSCDEELALALLPVQDETGVLVTRYDVTQCTESSHDFNVFL